MSTAGDSKRNCELLHPTTEYAKKITDGQIVACKWEKIACQRHLDDLKKTANDNTYKYIFDETRADRIIKWFTYCRHVRGPFSGQPIILDLWQQFDLGCIFGWVHKDTGKRRFTTAYIRVARGNTKSTLMSGVANYGMCSDAYYPPGADLKKNPELLKFEMKPEVVCGAVDKEQAKIVWDDAKGMADASPDISKHLKCQETKVSHRTRGGSLKRLSKDTKNKDGGSPCIIIIDEYHAHPTSIVKDTTSSGKGKRSQCLEFIVTTAGEDAENKPCKIEDDIVKKILSGIIINDSYFGMIREIDDEDDPHDETKWPKPNPVFQNDNEYSRTLKNQIKEEHDLAFGSGDNSKIRQWLIKRVDRWQADSEAKYFSGCMEKWKKLAVTREEFAAKTFGKFTHIGIDIGKCEDLTGDAFVFNLPDGGYAVCAHGFIPENTVKKHEKGDRVPYRDWIKDGWCDATPGDVTDDRVIRKHIVDTSKTNDWKIKDIGFDPYGARQLSNEMTEDGYTMVEIRQGVATLSEPTKKFRELVLQGKIIHDGSPLLTWCLSNALEVKDNNGNIKLSKKHKDDSQRIDLAAAIINAMVRAIVESPEPVYNKRGMRDL
jgi:phage terminase large subunit-like protein